MWNRKRKRDHWGRKVYAARPEREWVRIAAPELRVVSDELWKAAHDRLDQTRRRYLRATDGKLHGKPANGADSKYLLTGLLQCGSCGGALVVVSKWLTHGRRRYAYACSTNRFRGKATCPNGVWLPMEQWDGWVLQLVREKLLDPDHLRQAVEAVLADLQPAEEELSRRRTDLAGRLEETEQALKRLTTAIAAGGELPGLLAAVREREGERAKLQRQLDALDGPRVTSADVEEFYRQVQDAVPQLKAALTGDVQLARQALQKLLPSRLIFREVRDGQRVGYQLAGSTPLARILNYLRGATRMVTPAGSEPAIKVRHALCQERPAVRWC